MTKAAPTNIPLNRSLFDMSAVSVSSCFSVPPRRRRCCRCNGSAKCLRCACVRNGTPCSHCLPGEAGNCHNTLPGPSSQPSQVPTPSSPPTPGLVLPSLPTVLQSSIPTLQHVPKGARDRWAGVLSDCLSAVVEDPADISCWSKVFMLAKCVLASPSAGHRLRWREVLRLVRTRIQRWVDGDLAALWSEAVAGAQSLSKHSLSTSQHSSNIRRAKLAVQDGQFSKAIKALTSDGLAIPSADVLQDMLAKHPQSTPPSLPPGLVPPPVTVSESAVRKGVRSFPNGSAPGPSGRAQATSGRPLGALLLTELTRFWLPSPGLSIFWLLAELHPTSPLTFVGPHSWPARRKREASVPLLLGRFCVG